MMRDLRDGSIGEVAGRQFDELVTALCHIMISSGQDDGPGQRPIQNGVGQLLERDTVEPIKKLINEQETRTLNESPG